MVNTKTNFFILILIFLFYGCVPPPYQPEQSEVSSNDHWENIGKISASFISSSRTLCVNTNTGSPSFNVTFIASASNIDSLVWSFPGGKTNDSVSEITETVAYEKFGKFTYEMWRACRLVVDTGLHAKGWSKKKAIDYMSKNTALSLHEVNTEIDRYISWPGQALSYKIGELKIRELRNKAKDQLNDKFDIREFHEKILEYGTVTLPTLERRINNYIEKENE